MKKVKAYYYHQKVWNFAETLLKNEKLIIKWNFARSRKYTLNHNIIQALRAHKIFLKIKTIYLKISKLL